MNFFLAAILLLSSSTNTDTTVVHTVVPTYNVHFNGTHVAKAPAAPRLVSAVAGRVTRTLALDASGQTVSYDE
jgi:hypothetical protein